MIKVSISYETEEEKMKFMEDINVLKNYKVIKPIKCRRKREKSPYKKIYIDLVLK